MKKAHLSIIAIIFYLLLLSGCSQLNCPILQRLNVLGWSSDQSKIFFHYQSSTGIDDTDYLYEYNLENKSLKQLENLSKIFPDFSVGAKYYSQQSNELLLTMSKFEPTAITSKSFYMNMNTLKRLPVETQAEDIAARSSSALSPDKKMIIFTTSSGLFFFNRETDELSPVIIDDSQNMPITPDQVRTPGWWFFNNTKYIFRQSIDNTYHLTISDFDIQNKSLKNFKRIVSVEASRPMNFLGQRDSETLIYYKFLNNRKKVVFGTYNVKTENIIEKESNFNIPINFDYFSYSEKHNQVAFVYDNKLHLANIDTGKIQTLFDMYWELPKEKNVTCSTASFF